MKGKGNVKRVLFLMIFVFITGCFDFDDNSKDGFTVDGVYNGGTSTKISTCTNAELNALFFNVLDSYNDPENAEPGSVRISLMPSCFPDDASTGFARFDYVSPSVEWKDVTGYSYYLKTALSGLYTQPFLKIRKSNGDIVFIREVSSTGTPVFKTVSTGGWGKYTFNLPDVTYDYTILGVVIRMFVPNRTIALYGGPEAVIQLDYVMPTLSLSPSTL